MVQGVVTSILSGRARWARSRGRIVTYLDDKTIQVERRGLDVDNGVTPVQAFFQMYDIVEWLEV